ncbi:GNAT family N-acetyltransferase [Bacillus sp. JJ1562]|uniref:GNAT family N-acetyltransferase n=1 Tax=Bacillus sp. JJ1562 TaxID=3122960 RepID=UPI0030025405
MTVTLQKITRDNWEECIDLQVGKSQKGFIASNLYSIAEVQFLPNFEAFAIYADIIMVGFTMFGLDEDDNNYWIYRIMIDEKYQGKGYGTKALLNVIDYIKAKPDAKEIIIGYNPENIEAERTYIRAGFQPKAIAPWGEKLVSLKL